MSSASPPHRPNILTQEGQGGSWVGVEVGADPLDLLEGEMDLSHRARRRAIRIAFCACGSSPNRRPAPEQKARDVIACSSGSDVSSAAIAGPVFRKRRSNSDSTVSSYAIAPLLSSDAR